MGRSCREGIMGKLDGKVAIVTGAAGGIGRAAAHLFAHEGGRILIVDREEGALAALAQEIALPRTSVMVTIVLLKVD
jgi:NAD(P)-dependent dehydrogenase (short-subunit alcohol dehydrogenase family)